MKRIKRERKSFLNLTGKPANPTHLRRCPAGKLINGMTTIEYSVLVAVLLLALIGMTTSLRRAVCGKWRSAGDSFGGGMQYDPVNTTVIP